MSFDFEKSYMLKVQTPIIHFQHRQDGATLRASEVKPKLDRFLITRYGKDVDDSWRSKKHNTSLNYKLRFENIGQPILVELGRNTPYDIFYGNGRDAGTNKKGVKCDVKMTIICTIGGLREFINEHIAEFFIATNFGTMQNKGFGSFVVDGNGTFRNPNQIAKVLKEVYGAQKCYAFCQSREDEIFKSIKNVYGIMKSGRNFGGYQRSLLFLFLHKNEYKIGNEKAWMKKEGIAPIKGTHPYNQNPQNHEPYYVRALLGVGSHYDFLNRPGESWTDKTIVKVSHVESDNDPKIERLCSPIFFKVIGNNVYFLARKVDPNDRIYGKTFKFSSGMGTDVLTVPPKELLGEDFMEKFLVFCKEQFNNVVFKKFENMNGLKIMEV